MARRLPIRAVRPCSRCLFRFASHAKTLPPRTRRSSGLEAWPTTSGDAVRPPFAELASGRVRFAERDEAHGTVSSERYVDSRRCSCRSRRRGHSASLPAHWPRTRLKRPRLRRGLRSAAFERLGATADADATAALLRQLGARRARIPQALRTADQTGDRGTCTAGRRMLERGDRAAPRHQPPHRRAPRGPHPLQARAAKPC